MPRPNRSRFAGVDLERSLIVGFLVVFGIAIVAGVVVGVYDWHQKKVYLMTHECMLISEMKTGRTLGCGKGCVRDELVRLYECRDGTHLDLDGVLYDKRETK